MHFFWQKKAPSTLDPKFKLLGQNQAQLAWLAVLFFWRPVIVNIPTYQHPTLT